MSSTDDDYHKQIHLGTAWEIALVTFFVVVILAVLLAVFFQTRKQNRKRRLLEDSNPYRPRREKKRSNRGILPSSVSSSSSSLSCSKKKPTVVVEEEDAEWEDVEPGFSKEPIAKPARIASPHHQSRSYPHYHPPEPDPKAALSPSSKR